MCEMYQCVSLGLGIMDDLVCFSSLYFVIFFFAVSALLCNKNKKIKLF